jgi:hypothetical protein
MPSTINASASSGLITTADTSSILQLQTGGTTAVTISAAQVATFAQAPVLPAASIPQAALAAGVAGTGPAFSAYVGTNQTISNNTNTKIQFTAENFDTNSNFDSSTNYRFTPTVAGYYQLNCNIALGGAYAQAQIWKNGALYLNGPQITIAYTGGSTAVSALIYLNGSTDYVEFYAFQASGSSQTLYSPSINSQCSGSMVRGA